MKHLIFCLLLAAAPVAAAAQSFEALKADGAVGLMRHALAPGVGDPARFDLADCATQRTLSAQGRDQARRTGDALRAAGVTFDQVWTSQWCRAKNTALLLDVGPVTEVPALNSHFAGRGDPVDQTRQVRRMLAALPPGSRVLLVSHQVNIRALAGEGTASGEIIAATREPDGSLKVVGSYLVAP